MKYLGGKHKIGGEISRILKHVCPEHINRYLEPFCGALGVLRHMTSDFICTASDIQPDMIHLWIGVKNGTFISPTNITETFYKKVKSMKKHSALKGFVGFLCSWNGMYFAGLANYKGTNRNVCREANNDIKKVRPLLKKVTFKCASYDKYNPKDTLIYCDPPYEGTIGYTGTKGEFDHASFWNKMREWSKTNIVIISEEQAPKDFKCMWKKGYSRGRGFKSKKSNPKGKDVFEKLFIHRDNYDLLRSNIRTIHVKSTKPQRNTKRRTKRKTRRK